MTRILIVICLAFFSCKIDREKNVNREKFSFKMGDDTELFFKNMRASAYEKEERKDTRWDIYRHEDLYNDSSEYALNIAIVVNVMQDEAYLLLEPGALLMDNEKIVVHTSDSTNSNIKEFVLEHRSKEDMLEFATNIYEAIRDKQDLQLVFQDTKKEIFTAEIQREAFRRTMADYYRLTRIF